MVGDRIKELRTNLNLTINELAHLSQVSKSYISSIERGLQKNPSIKVLKKLAVTLQVPLESIISFGKHEITLDEEWIEPLEEAIDQGLTKEEFHEFLSFFQYKRMKKIDE
ncbi:helix-turn-helix domain-containing protein [Rossellomorea oryzaecorticis]|jgi:XRE family transcriptional regulator, master regulator for biofilm formation|uniref:Helix-turn-helix domain-containing protein n=1 Tax=Rossellomorea oryzaecorticis TaxID=1396505 RepID=A0ABW8VQV1_9BACI